MSVKYAAGDGQGQAKGDDFLEGQGSWGNV